MNACPNCGLLTERARAACAVVLVGCPGANPEPHVSETEES